MSLARTLPLAALTALFVLAQEPAGPAFDAVAIRPGGTTVFVSNGPSAPFNSPARTFRYVGDRVNGNQSIQAIMREAWYLKDYQIAGPAWIGDDLWDIAAITPANTPKEVARLMLQTMLQQRFGLKCHMERREVPVYAMVVAQSGFKLQPIADPEAQKKKTVPTPMGNKQGVASVMGHGVFVSPATSLGEFAEQMSHYVDRPIIDLTKFNALYEINLHWQPQEVAPPGVAVQNAHNDVELPRVIEHELGLRLEPRKLPFEVLVIDHIEKKPTGN